MPMEVLIRVYIFFEWIYIINLRFFLKSEKNMNTGLMVASESCSNTYAAPCSVNLMGTGRFFNACVLGGSFQPPPLEMDFLLSKCAFFCPQVIFGNCAYVIEGVKFFLARCTYFWQKQLSECKQKRICTRSRLSLYLRGWLVFELLL